MSNKVQQIIKVSKEVLWNLLFLMMHCTGMTMSLESPPLWVWAIIAGIIVAGKLTYRWYATKRLAKD